MYICRRHSLELFAIGSASAAIVGAHIQSATARGIASRLYHIVFISASLSNNESKAVKRLALLREDNSWDFGVGRLPSLQSDNADL